MPASSAVSPYRLRRYGNSQLKQMKNVKLEAKYCRSNKALLSDIKSPGVDSGRLGWPLERSSGRSRKHAYQPIAHANPTSPKTMNEARHPNREMPIEVTARPNAAPRRDPVLRSPREIPR